MDNVIINATNQAIINTGSINITNSNIAGSTYAIYENSANDNTISNSMLRSNSSAVYKINSGVMSLNDNIIIGNISNASASSTLNVTNGSVRGWISNGGTSTYTNVPITYSSNYYNEENMVLNSGILYMNESSVTFNSSYGSGSGYYTTALNNSGTTTSYKTKYTVNHTNGKYKWMLGIRNTGLFTSTDDEIEITGAGASYALHNNSSNESTFDNLTINSHDNGNEIYAIRNAGGKLNVNGGTINMANNGNTIMIYTSGNSNTIVTDTVGSSTNNNSTSHAVYMQDDGGTINLIRGTYNVSGNNEVHAVNVDNGNLLVQGTDFTTNAGTTSYGLRIKNGNVTMESGSIIVNGTTTYGVNMTNGTYTQGILDDSGFENANISTTDPHIEAVGSNSGIGISMGSGVFNFYEGILIGSTSSRVSGDIITRTPNSYEVKTYTNDQGYSYSILEFIK